MLLLMFVDHTDNLIWPVFRNVLVGCYFFGDCNSGSPSFLDRQANCCSCSVCMWKMSNDGLLMVP